MTAPPIFSAAEDDGWEPFRQISKELKCSDEQVFDAFVGLELPEWNTPEHFESIKQRTSALNEAAYLAEKLHMALRRLPNDEKDSLVLAGAVTLAQIDYLAAILAGDAKSLEDWRKNRYPGGRINPAAHIVAEGIRRLFRRLRRPVGFGQKSDGGGAPSTDFGRAVEFALIAFGVRANWRRAAQAARDKQQKIERRLSQCRLSHSERAANANQK